MNSITGFNFNDFVPGNMYEVVVNPEGDTVDIIAPSVTYLPTPREGTACHHVYLSCANPTNSPLSGQTIIPMSGMMDYLFYAKRYIRREHALLNGKLNAWRIEFMKAIELATNSKRFMLKH